MFNPFSKKASPERKPSDDPQRHVLLTMGGTSKSVVTYAQASNAKEAMQHFVAYRCINKIAEAVQSVDWYVSPVRGIGKSKDEMAKITATLRSPNDTMSAGQLRYWMAANRAVYGRVPFKVGVGSQGYPNAIYPLRAEYFKAIISKSGAIEAYEYGSGENADKMQPRRKAEANGKFSGSFAAQIVRPNLEGSWIEGLSNTPLNSIGLPAEITRLLMHRAVETAAGHPNSKYIISSEKALTKQQFDGVQEHIESSQSGGSESGNILLLDGVTVNVTKLDNDLSDIHSKMPMDDMARHIAGAFGVPIALLGLGAADGAKFASNFGESRRAFYEDTIIPGYLQPIAEGLTAALCSDGYEIKFDLDSIEALADGRVAKAERLSKVDFLTENEKRELCGFAPRSETTND